MIDSAFEAARIAYWNLQGNPHPNDRLRAAIEVYLRKGGYETQLDQAKEQQPADSGATQAVVNGGGARLPHLSQFSNNTPLQNGGGGAQESRPGGSSLPISPLSWLRSYRRWRSEQKAMAGTVYD